MVNLKKTKLTIRKPCWTTVTLH